MLYPQLGFSGSQLQQSGISKGSVQPFPYHMVSPSPWPILISFSLLFLTIGTVSWMQGYDSTTMRLGFTLTLWTMLQWFLDVENEGNLEGNHTKKVGNGIFTGFCLFVISEVFFFLAFFWAFFHLSLVPSIEIGGVWPPQGIIPLNALAIPLLNTVLLLSSGVSVTEFHHALINGDKLKGMYSLSATVLLASVFTALQYLEYVQSGFTIADSVYGSTFYSTTGLHGLHVLVGTIFLFFCLLKLVNYRLTLNRHIGVECGILYWHFVDIVWLLLFISIYYWGGM
uniref:Cytochrome c oxidase subunit 3 n=2 Tax=cellular organisms TaxID=131567 RepID=A0A481ZKB5_9AGAM|nr:cytochrome c oxidase subunit 3 [Phlebopus portentosus]